MKTNKLWSIFMMLVLTLGTLVSFSSCGGDDEEDEVSVSMPNVNFDENGGSQIIQVMSNTKWTVSGNPSWVSVAPAQGSKNGSFSISVNRNSDQSSRNCVLYINAGNASAVVSVSQSAHVPDTRVTVTNNSTYTLYRFRIVFMNSKNESLTDRDYGTFDPGTTITADIPTSATQFYMATYINSKWYFSPDYDVTYTRLNLSTAEIGGWKTNGSSSRYPNTSSEN